MIFYYLVILLSIFVAFKAEKKNSLTMVTMLIIIISLLAGLRDLTVGRDTYTYYRIFNNIASGGFSTFEPGFVFICRCLLKVFGDVRILFLIFAFVTNSLIILRLWTLKDKCSFGFMFFLYITIFFPQSMNIMRQYLAIAIVFYATKYLEKSHYVKFIILTIITITIHFSSAIALFFILPYYYAEKKGITKKKILLTLLLIAGSPLIFKGFNLVYSNYTTYLEGETEKISLLIIFRICIIGFYWLLMLMSNNYLNTKEKNNMQFKNIAIIYSVGIMLSTIGGFYEYVGRISIYFMVFEIPFASMITRIEKSKLFKFIYIFLALYFLIIKTGILGESRIIPYKLYMFN